MNDFPGFRYPDGTIIVFARAPVPGKVKTRLAAAIGSAEAVAVYERLVLNVLETATRSRLAPVELHVTGYDKHPFFLSLAQRLPVSLRLQKGNDLGERMHNAIKDCLQTRTFALLIGTDCPALTAGYLEQACAALDSGMDTVLGPAEDGGYVLIGARSSDKRLFSGIPWGTSRVLDRTRKCLDRIGWQYLELDTLWDVDEIDDYRRWCTQDRSVTTTLDRGKA